MQRRQEEAQHALLVRELERVARTAGLKHGLSDTFKDQYVRGAGELELVRSGLDDTMRTAYQSMREVWHSRKDVEDLRTAAYLVSIARVAASYRSKGL
jgi:glutamate dehydrogenase (NAD(P)+)